MVEVELQVADSHEPRDYICVAIQVYESNGNMEMVKNPMPTRVFKIVDDEKNDDTQKTELLGWPDMASQRRDAALRTLPRRFEDSQDGL